MGFDLGLSLNSSPIMVKPKRATDQTMVSFEPLLTLGLSDNHRDPTPNPSEESERVNSNDNNCSRVMMSGNSVDDGEDYDDGCVNGKKKLRLTKPQSALLEEAFKLHNSLNPKQKQELARELKLRPRKVEVWFQNRRARTKLKQTEMDFKHLKKCCEKLTYENQILQKELQELKASKSSQPFYMQMRATTLTMCPSCETIGDTKSSTVKNPFTMTAKSLFNSFSNPSAAC